MRHTWAHGTDSTHTEYSRSGLHSDVSHEINSQRFWFVDSWPGRNFNLRQGVEKLSDAQTCTQWEPGSVSRSPK